MALKGFSSAPIRHAASSSSSSSSSSSLRKSNSCGSFFSIGESSSSSKPPTTTRIRSSLRREQGNWEGSKGMRASPPRAAPSTTSFRTSSPLLTVEELATRLGFEMTVAELERLFRHSDPPGSPEDRGRPVRVAYQGVRGSYCQDAAARAFPASAAAREAFPCDHMEDAFAALEERSADRAVVPAENSIDGPIDRNLDLLLRHPSVGIVGELVLPVNHCLLSLPGAPRSGLRRVVSHPQALCHCAEHLRALDLDVEEVDNAADAARFLAENHIADTAVIGSEIAAREFGLHVLDRNLQDLPGNYNRFLQLALDPSSSPHVAVAGAGGACKTMVAFSLPNGVSDLCQAMWIFETRGVRVTRVDHRPNRSRPVRLVETQPSSRGGEVAYMDYVFVLDLEGSESDPCVEKALARLKEIAGFVRVLGSYVSTSITRE